MRLENSLGATMTEGRLGAPRRRLGGLSGLVLEHCIQPRFENSLDVIKAAGWLGASRNCIDRQAEQPYFRTIIFTKKVHEV